MKFEGGGIVQLNEESVFSRVTEYEIFKYYIPAFQSLNKKFCSPLREEKKPSCSIREHKGKMFYKDFGTNESYSTINFVKRKFNASYFEALKIISNDFCLGLSSGGAVTAKSMGMSGVTGLVKKSAPKETRIKIKSRAINSGRDKSYWGSYGWTKAIMEHFKVRPISHLWINDTYLTVKENNPSYAYIINDKFKILSPYSKDFKWLSNTTANDIQGWEQLPESGDLVVITSSLKDVGLLYRYGYISCAPSSENTAIPFEKMEELKRRFKKIVVLFDADEAGIDAAKVYVELYDIESVSIPLGSSKDPSDHYRFNGDKSTKELLNNILK